MKVVTRAEYPSSRTRDWAAFFGLLAAFVALYRATVQGRVFSQDGAFLSEWSVVPGAARESYHNVLFPRVSLAWNQWLEGGWFAGAGPTVDPLAMTEWLGALCGGFGVACVFAAIRSLGFRRRSAVGAAVLLGVTPPHWFFATVVEVHSMHFAVVALCALAVCAAPWRRPVVATAIVCSVLPLTYLSHQSAPALGFGWVGLAQCARLRATSSGSAVVRPFSILQLALLGTAMLGSLMLGQSVVSWCRGLGFGLGLGDAVHSVMFWRRSMALTVLWEEIVMPLAILLVVGVLGLMRRRTTGSSACPLMRSDRNAMWLDCSALAMFAPSVAFMLYWGIVERGGYMIGPAVGLALWSAAWLESPRWPRRRLGLALGIAVAIQAGLGLFGVKSHDSEGFQVAERAALIGELFDGQPGRVLTIEYLAPSISVHHPNIDQLDLLPSFYVAETGAQWIEENLDTLLTLLDTVQPFVLDRSYRQLGAEWTGVLKESMLELERRIIDRFEVTEHERAGWSVWFVWSE